MIPLKELLDYWRTVYPIGYGQRQPRSNDCILATIRYLEELATIKGDTALPAKRGGVPSLIV